MPATNRMTGTHAHIHVSTKPVWGPVSELVDLRYRPEVNTIEALAESDPSEHYPDIIIVNHSWPPGAGARPLGCPLLPVNDRRTE